jgi:hypothetical protein
VQQVKVFDGYGDLQRLEAKFNSWLDAEPRRVLSLMATDLRLFVRWRPARDVQRSGLARFKLFRTMDNGATEERFREFFLENPDTEIALEVCNQSFIIWLVTEKA